MGGISKVENIPSSFHRLWKELYLLSDFFVNISTCPSKAIASWEWSMRSVLPFLVRFWSTFNKFEVKWNSSLLELLHLQYSFTLLKLHLINAFRIPTFDNGNVCEPLQLPCNARFSTFLFPNAVQISSCQ